jgi:hypothetical protein
LTPAPDEEDTMSINPVEDALDEMLAALKEGADPWTVPTLVGDAYKDQLRSDFTSLIKLWDSVRDRLKRMARHSGSLAGLVAQGAPSSGQPRDLLEQEVFRGAAIVKDSKACPLIDGRFCQSANFGQLQEALDGVFTPGKVTVNNQP